MGRRCLIKKDKGHCHSTACPKQGHDVHTADASILALRQSVKRHLHTWSFGHGGMGNGSMRLVEGSQRLMAVEGLVTSMRLVKGSRHCALIPICPLNSSDSRLLFHKIISTHSTMAKRKRVSGLQSTTQPPSPRRIHTKPRQSPPPLPDHLRISVIRATRLCLTGQVAELSRRLTISQIRRLAERFSDGESKSHIG